VDFELPGELELLRATVREFVEQELIPIEMSVPDAEEVPDEILRPLQEKARALGLWMIDVPAEFGGAGLGLLPRAVITEEIAKTVALPFRGGIELFGPHLSPILLECNEDQRERYVYPVLRGERRACFAQTEPDAGSDPSSMRTRAVRDGEDWVLNGTKRFITLAHRADFATVLAVTDPDARRGRNISCFLVDMDSPGVRLLRPQPTMMGDAPWEIAFDDVRVPGANLVGEEGGGFALGQGFLTVGRVLGHGAFPVGVAQRALEMAIDYAKVRVTFGQPLAERQAVQFMIADSAIELHAARLMVHRCAWRYDEGLDTRDESYMVKVYCSEMVNRVLDRAIQIHGSLGLTKELPLERWFRQMRSIRITEGVTEVMRWRLARNLVRARP
jgi:acyl-CoA dehydrogenase